MSVRVSILTGLAALSIAPQAFAAANAAEALKGSLSGIGKVQGLEYSAEETAEMELKRLHFLNLHIGTQHPFVQPVTWEKGRLKGTFTLDSDTKARFQKVANQNVHCLRYVHQLFSTQNSRALYTGRTYACLDNGVWGPVNQGDVFETPIDAAKGLTGNTQNVAQAKPAQSQKRPEELQLPSAPGPVGPDHTYAFRNVIDRTTLGNMVHRIKVMTATLKDTLAKDTRIPHMGEESKRKYILDTELAWTRYYTGYFAWGLQQTSERAAIPALMGAPERSIAFDQLKFVLDELPSDESRLTMIKIFLGFEWDASSAEGKWKRSQNTSNRIDFRPAKLSLVTSSIQNERIKREIENDVLQIATKEGLRDYVAGEIKEDRPSRPSKRRRY